MFKEDIRIDSYYNLAYVYFSADSVARTEMVHELINIDLNSVGEIYGIEFLDTKAMTFSTATEIECDEEDRERFIGAILTAQEKVLGRLVTEPQ